MKTADAPESKNLLDAVPRPEVVAQRLGAAMREVNFLRRLLKTAKAAELERRNLSVCHPQNGGLAHAG